MADQRATLTSVCFGASGTPTHPKSLAEDAVSESGWAAETQLCPVEANSASIKLEEEEEAGEHSHTAFHALHTAFQKLYVASSSSSSSSSADSPTLLSLSQNSSRRAYLKCTRSADDGVFSLARFKALDMLE